MSISAITYAQRNIDNLCYNYETKVSIAVNSEIDLSTLTISEKLSFQEKVLNQKNHSYFDSEGNTVTDVLFISQDNVMPKWYHQAEVKRYDSSGAKSFYTTNSTYFDGGWVGAHQTQNTSFGGNYKEDSRTGERYLELPYEAKAQEAYNNTNQMVQSKGFIYRLSYNYPSQAELTELLNSGYAVTNQDGILSISNDNYLVLIDEEHKIIAKQQFEDTELVSTTKTYYTYQENFDEYLLDKEVRVSPKKFENGGCYDEIREVTYTNYEADCEIANTSFNFGENLYIESNNDHLEYVNELVILPNPVENNLNIDIPSYQGTSTLKLYNATGNLILQRKIVPENTRHTLDVSSLTPGLYVVKVDQNDMTYSCKMIKQ